MRDANDLTSLPVLLEDHDGESKVRCPICGQFLARNYVPDAQGYASLNCNTHGWVGKWRAYR